MDIVLKVGIALIIGFAGGKIAAKLRLPSVSGYVVVGLFLGPSLNLLFKNYGGFLTDSNQQSVYFISELALCFIAFSIGSEFTVKSLKSLGKSVFIMTSLEVLFAVSFVFLLLYLTPAQSLGMSGKEKLAFALIMSSLAASTAPAATIMVMRQYNAYGPVSKTIIGITALDDIYGIVTFGIFMTIAKILTGTSNPNIPLAFSIFQPLLEILGSIAIGAIIAYSLVYLTKRFNKSRDDLQILILAAIIISFGLTKTLSRLTHITFSPLLTNIVIGVGVANLNKKPQRVFNALNDFVAPFYILFFTFAGASLNLKILASVGVLGIAFIIARGTGKYLGSLLGGKISKTSPEVAKFTGLGLFPQGGITIGLLIIIAAELPAFYGAATTIAMVSILFYETVGPVFAKIAIKRSGEINGLDHFMKTQSLPEEIKGE